MKIETKFDIGDRVEYWFQNDASKQRLGIIKSIYYNGKTVFYTFSDHDCNPIPEEWVLYKLVKA